VRPPPPVPPIAELTDSRLRALLDPRRLVRWGYAGRLLVAGAMFVAALSRWQQAPASVTLVASLACVSAFAVTAASALLTEVWGRPLTRGFLYLHAAFDLLLVTAVVHLTGGLGSQFAALYLLVIVAASLLLRGGGLLVTALALSCYLADGLLLSNAAGVGLTAWLQFAVFGAVAACSAAISVRLHELGAGQEELTAELVQFRVQASEILRSIRSGIVTVSAEGRLLYANPAATALLGVDLARGSGRAVLPAIAAVAPGLAAALERGLATGERTTRGEGAVTTAGGRVFPIGVATTVTESGARGVAVTAIFQDISEGKRLEALHRRAERLEAVAGLSASLAHEIRNPLASIRSAVEQLAAVPRADEDERTLAGLIVRESDRLSRLLGEFLDFARVRMRHVARVELASVVAGAAALARAHPDRAAGVELRCEAPDALLVEGDEDLLHRAVFNLVLNAVQATPEPGEVVVRLERATAAELPPGPLRDGGAVSLRVSDTGPGIAPEVRERLFDPFTTTKPGGSGLGLSVVQRAIEAHRGVVLVDSDATGTRFTVLLPVAQDDERLVARGAPPEPHDARFPAATGIEATPAGAARPAAAHSAGRPPRATHPASPA
jgi:two-component system sensor histidine kinase PilS (NtrC family)